MFLYSKIKVKFRYIKFSPEILYPKLMLFKKKKKNKIK